jgi:hypothetical protein
MMRQAEIVLCQLHESCEFVFIWDYVLPIFESHNITVEDYVEDNFSISVTISGDIDNMNLAFGADVTDQSLIVEINENPHIEIRYNIEEDEMYWIVMKKDDALLGLKKGKQSQETISGPYFDHSKALDAMAKLSKLTENSWFAVVKSDEKPKRTETTYEFHEDYDNYDY